MIQRWAAPALGLLVCGLFTTRAASQVPNQRADSNRRWGTLRQNQPNPFANETTIPFSVGDAGCAVGTQHVVTIRIYNILSQVVAVPALVDSTSGDHSVAPARAVNNLALGCGDYVARWDGKHTRDSRDAPPGVYMYQLVVDGHPAGMKKMVITR